MSTLCLAINRLHSQLCICYCYWLMVFSLISGLLGHSRTHLLPALPLISSVRLAPNSLGFWFLAASALPRPSLFCFSFFPLFARFSLGQLWNRRGQMSHMLLSAREKEREREKEKEPGPVTGDANKFNRRQQALLLFCSRLMSFNRMGEWHLN